MADKPNPFKRLHGVPAAPQGAQDTGLQGGEPPDGSLCPFLGGISVPMLDRSALVKPGMNPLEAIQTGVAFNACQGAQCHFWNVGREACVLKLAALAQVDAAKALAELKVLLAPLGTFFQSRG